MKRAGIAGVGIVAASNGFVLTSSASPSGNDPQKKVVYIKYSRNFQNVFAVTSGFSLEASRNHALYDYYNDPQHPRAKDHVPPYYTEVARQELAVNPGVETGCKVKWTITETNSVPEFTPPTNQYRISYTVTMEIWYEYDGSGYRDESGNQLNPQPEDTTLTPT